MLPLPAAGGLAHGATGTWLDEFVEFGLPLILFVVLYFWSSRKPKAAPGRRPADASKRSPETPQGEAD